MDGMNINLILISQVIIWHGSRKLSSIVDLLDARRFYWFCRIRRLPASVCCLRELVCGVVSNCLAWRALLAGACCLRLVLYFTIE